MLGSAATLHGAWRRLRRAPAFTAVALLTMGAGVAANVAVFAVLRAVVLDPLPFADADRLRWVRPYPETDPATRLELSHPVFRDLAERTDAFAAMAAFPTAEGRRVWEAGSGVAAVRAARVSGGYFDVLGTPPLLGRTLEPADDVPGAPPVVVLSWRTWQARLGGARDVLGRTIRLDARPYTVVGVMPRGFADPAAGEAWTALVPEVGDFAENRNVGFLHVIGRLRPGVADDPAAAGTSRILADLAAANGPAGASRPGATLLTLGDALYGSARPALLMLAAAAALVLLLTCVNLAALLLARSVTRRRDLTVRAALGASRHRLVTELGTEALVLGAGAGVAGLCLAAFALDGFATLLPADLYRADAVRIDSVVVALGLLLSVLAAVAFGTAAAVAVTRRLGGAASAAVRSTAGVQARRTGSLLVGAQIAIAVVVLVAGGLLGRSFLALQDADTGFRTRDVLSFELFLPDDGLDATRVAAIHERVRARLAALPGVERAASVLLRPLEGPEGYDYPFTVEHRAAADQTANPLLNYEAVTPEYFETVGLPLRAGRPFTQADDADAAPVVIVSDAVARRFFPDGHAVGRRMKWGGPSADSPWMTVVGVAGAARYRGIADVSLDAYVPAAQAPWALRHIVLRTAGDGIAIAAALPGVVADVHPGAHPIQVASLATLADVALARPRFHAALFGVFALTALLLAAIGTFGVVSHFTARRRRELGVRLVLGARPRGLAGLILRETARTALAGTAAGLLIAAFGARALRGLLWGVPTFDPLTFGGSAFTVCLITLAAAWPHARRAARTDPALVLRQE